MTDVTPPNEENNILATDRVVHPREEIIKCEGSLATLAVDKNTAVLKHVL